MPKRKYRRSAGNARQGRKKRARTSGFKKIDWKKGAAKVAGGALGFIHGNIPGAVAGYSAAGKAVDISRKIAASFANRKAVTVKAESTGLQWKNLGTVSLASRKSRPRKTMGTYQYDNINQWVINSFQGEQVVDFTECLFTRDQSIGITSNERGERYKWPDDPYTLNPFYRRTATTVYSIAPPGTGPEQNDLMYIKRSVCEFSMLGMTKIPTNVTIYYLTPKYDTDEEPITCWNNALVAKEMGQVAQAESTSLAVSTATAGGSKATDIGANPFYHKDFRNQWSALKTVKVVLQAGEQLNTRLTIEYNKVVSRQMLLSTRTRKFLRGLTVYPLVIAHTGLVGLKTDIGAEASEVGYGIVKLGTVVRYHTTFGALAQDRFSTARTYSGLVERSTAQVRVIDDEDDVEDANVRA